MTRPGSLEAPDLGNEDGVSDGKLNTRRYSPEEEEQAVRPVRQLRAEMGTSQGTVKRVAEQLGYGTDSVRLWLRQAHIDDGERPSTATADAERIKRLKQENRELKRANETLRRASTFLAAELDRPQK